MVWKKVYQEETEAAAHVLKFDNAGYGEQSMVIPIKQSVGKRVRITVEEEVNECCAWWVEFFERWIPTSVIDGCHFKAARRCPECGRKLEA